MTNFKNLVKYGGDNSAFIWKHPCDCFYPSTQIIVHESQEAILCINGEALDLFSAGRYVLDEQGIFDEYPLDDEPCVCGEVYFINKTVKMAMKWGTESKVKLLDPSLKIPVELGACGELNLTVADSRRLLLKLVGSSNGIARETSSDGFTISVKESFRALVSNAVKANLPSIIKSENLSLFELDEHIEEISRSLKKCVIEGFEEYGLTVPEFYITSIALPEDDPDFIKMKSLNTVLLQKRVIEAEAEIRKAQLDADTAVSIAQNRAEIEMINLENEKARTKLEGLSVFENAQGEDTVRCKRCSNIVKDAKYCSYCGKKLPRRKN